MSGNYDDPSESNAPESLDFDTALELLADRSRRRLLVEFLERERAPSHADRLSVETIYPETGSDSGRVTAYHVHLPKLESKGVIRWDRARDVVEPGPQFDRIQPLLALLDDNADRLYDEWP